MGDRERTETLPKGVAMGERRRSPRLPITVGCQAVVDEEFFLLGDEIVDLSADGLLLRASGIPALVGEEVIVSFRPPNSAEWIDAEAVIVRLLNGTQPGAPGFGIELKNLGAFDRARLAATVERLQAAKQAGQGPTPVRERIRFLRRDSVATLPAVAVH